jgi:hypothetical protein
MIQKKSQLGLSIGMSQKKSQLGGLSERDSIEDNEAKSIIELMYSRM